MIQAYKVFKESKGSLRTRAMLSVALLVCLTAIRMYKYGLLTESDMLKAQKYFLRSAIKDLISEVE